MVASPGRFVISFDFELFWGVRDTTTLARYGRNILGARDAVPRLLDLFDQYGVRSTWGTVGFLFFESKEELLAHLPAITPRYLDPQLSPYAAISEIGRNERSDPYHFGLSLIRQIMGCPGQEIGTHTFSHYYCLEPGQDESAFRADLDAAKRAAARLGITLRSITFPRHQIDYLRACREAGLIAFRGQPRVWMHDPNERKMPAKRLLRVTDAYLPLSGHNARRPTRGTSGMIEVPASRFLRPFAPRLRSLEGLRLRRITRGMRQAAETGAIYHLWWHPHNFGTHMEDNFAMLRRILDVFRELALEQGMQANTMAEIADLLGAAADSGTQPARAAV